MPGLDAWERAVADGALLEAAAACDAKNVSEVARLRKTWDAQAVAAALELSAARAKLGSKWGDRAASMISDVPGAEMATSRRVAERKAARLGVVNGSGGAGEPVLDLCCGIGADTGALERFGVEAVDLDPVRAWMAGANAPAAQVTCGDAEDQKLEGRVVHVDPQRRSGRGRVWRYEDLVPGPGFLERVAAEARGACLKLGPGVDRSVLPAGELEVVSEEGRLVAAHLWSGACAEVHARAVLLGDASAHELTGEAELTEAAPVRALGRYVYEADPAPERAGLLGVLCRELDAGVVHPGLGVLSSDALLESSWVRGFEVIERMPWRRERVRDAVRGYGGGVVEVKTRGGACDPDREQLALRGDGDRLLTVWVLRLGEKIEAVISRRLRGA